MLKTVFFFSLQDGSVARCNAGVKRGEANNNVLHQGFKRLSNTKAPEGLHIIHFKGHIGNKCMWTYRLFLNNTSTELTERCRIKVKSLFLLNIMTILNLQLSNVCPVQEDCFVWLFLHLTKGLSASRVMRFVSHGVCVSSASRVSVAASLWGKKNNIQMRWTLGDGGWRSSITP